MGQLGRQHARQLEIMKEAVSCGVCMDTLEDPHS